MKMISCLGRCIGPCSINSFIKRNMPDRPKEEQQAMKYYLYQLHVRKGSGEYGLYKVSDNLLYGKKPTMDIMEDLDDRVGVAVRC